MKTIDDLKEFLIQSLPNERIYLFGSRARGDESIYSDIDIAIEGDEALSDRLPLIRLIIEESQIPQKVDLVNLSQAPYLRSVIKKEGIVWQ